MLFSVLTLLCLLFSPSHSYDGGLTTQNDPGAVFIRQLQSTIDKATCQLVKDTTYTDYDVFPGESFDFIVVGGGSAGSVVASRLSENPSWRVLLLEAGGDPPIASEIPGLSSMTWNPTYDWLYFVQPESNCFQGQVNKSCLIHCGKVLGGSSTINGIWYVRGNPQDFNDWEQMGNPGWGYENMLPYFKKSEGVRSEEVTRNYDYLKYHGVNGPLKVETFEVNITDEVNLFAKAFQEIGIHYHDDYNAQYHEGFFSIQGTLENARRCSTAKAFLHKTQSRRNLKISKNSFVRKVLVNSKNKAYGVEFTKRGQVFIAKASKEIILSAGPIKSPQLLMLSGIGPEGHLRDMGIDIVQNAAVGYNFHDHIPMLGFLFTIDWDSTPENTIDNTFEFLVNSRGTLAGVGESPYAAFTRLSMAKDPNLMIYLSMHPANTTDSLAQFLVSQGFSEEIARATSKVNAERFTVVVTPALLQPRNRGRLLLRSKNPLDQPFINPQCLSIKEDKQDMLEAIQILTAFTKTKALAKYRPKIERYDIPECRKFAFQSEGFWLCVIKYMTFSSYHQVGTCKMGPRGKWDSVVDSYLQVIGVSNLRVIDSSIMPKITRGNTNAPTIAIAEKGCNIIKQHWRSS